MSDNTTLNPGTLGDTYRSRERSGGVKTQVVGIDHAPVETAELLMGAPRTLRCTYTSAQSDTSMLGAISSSQYVVITGIDVAASNDLASSPAVRIGFNSSASTPATDGVIFSHPGISAAWFCSKGGAHAPIAKGGLDEELYITTGTITTGTVDVVVTYFVVS